MYDYEYLKNFNKYYFEPFLNDNIPYRDEQYEVIEKVRAHLNK